MLYIYRFKTATSCTWCAFEHDCIQGINNTKRRVVLCERASCATPSMSRIMLTWQSSRPLPPTFHPHRRVYARYMMFVMFSARSFYETALHRWIRLDHIICKECFFLAGAINIYLYIYIPCGAWVKCIANFVRVYDAAMTSVRAAWLWARRIRLATNYPYEVRCAGVASREDLLDMRGICDVRTASVDLICKLLEARL